MKKFPLRSKFAAERGAIEKLTWGRDFENFLLVVILFCCVELLRTNNLDAGTGVIIHPHATEKDPMEGLLVLTNKIFDAMVDCIAVR